MNATSLDTLRAGIAARDPKDEKMEQIRDLLVGDNLRQTDARLLALETRLREVELRLTRRIDALSARLDALAGETDADRRTAFDQLSRSVLELGEHIRRIAKD